MARRRKKASSLEVILELFSRLPWWVGPPISLFVYLYLHSLASSPITTPTQDPGANVLASIFLALASILQYIIPAAILLGSMISAINRFWRVSLFLKATGRDASSVIRNMTWYEFELLIGEAFRRQGYTVEETPVGPDGGIDLVLHKERETFLVQCKHWKASKVSVQVVREFYGVVASSGAAGGFVITSGMFTKPAWAFAKPLNLTLIGGRDLAEMLKGIERPTIIADKEEGTDPNCPRCGSAMILRTANKGDNKGQRFYGCSTFPACRGTLPAFSNQ